MYNELMEKAKQAKLKAYCPYSNFRVGAALLTDDGKTYTGCNIENSSYSQTICAERVAVFKAVEDGNKSFSAIAVTEVPCGACLQVLSEFCSDDFKIFVSKDGEIVEYSIKDLLPHSFSL